MKPVVLVPAPHLLPVVLAGLERAGRVPKTVVLEPDEPPVASVRRLEDEEVGVLVFDHDEDAIPFAAHLLTGGARPIPVLRALLGVGVEPGCVAWLRTLPAELNVAVPSIDDDAERRLLWTSLDGAGIGDRHHLVDVDGRPALDELASRGLTTDGDPLELAAAGAAGVLAGRMVVANRRWQDAIRG